MLKKKSTTWVYRLPFTPFSAYETLKQCNTHAKYSTKKHSKQLCMFIISTGWTNDSSEMFQLLPSWIPFQKFWFLGISFFRGKKFNGMILLHFACYLRMQFFVCACFRFSFLAKQEGGNWGFNLFILYTNWHMKIEYKLSNKWYSWHKSAGGKMMWFGI